jgi:hypothetical protein
MFVADELPSADVHRRRSRRRSASSRVVRKVKHGWRRTKLRKAVFTLILGVVAVVGGYKASMYVVGHEFPSPDELNQVPQK